ncbi:MAG: beta-ketoacyl-ACP synthase III [Lachnospiraceae bacterium]|nr:beta-ketoacyl-ACP synthase III [Lachnospiraceae bacterium]
MIGKICGTGSYVPDHFLDNNDLSQMVETSDEWIRERTGVVRRHIVQDDTAVSMAVKASVKALENGSIAPEDIDLIIVSTFTSEVLLPCTACEVQKALGADKATCFDLNAACTGFLFAYNTAQAYLAQGIYRNALIIGAERLSRYVDWKDRSTCILFGDGAGAAVLKAEEGSILPMVTHSEGAKGEALTCMTRPDSYIQMDGQAVFRFAVKKVPEAVEELLQKAGMTMEDIDYLVLHQANRRIVEAVAKRLKTDISRFPMNLQEYGNTSSASIPILLDELNREGKLKRGQKIILAGFGAGLSWGASLVEW